MLFVMDNMGSKMKIMLLKGSVYQLVEGLQDILLNQFSAGIEIW